VVPNGGDDPLLSEVTPRPADQVRVAGNPTDALDEFDSAGKTSVPSHR
jgi:hypothetical protein